MLKTATGIVLTAGGFYALICLFMFFFQSSLIYFPSPIIMATPDMRGMDYEDVYLTTDDNVQIHGWFVPVEDPKATVLMFHGNAGNIGDRIESIHQFHALNLNVFIIDYRGYGISTGRVTEEGTYTDAITSWNYLTNTRQIPPDEIIIFGRSLGGGIASWLAVQDDVNAGGVVLESTFTSVPDLGSELYPFLPVRLLSRIHYNTLDRISEISIPMMIAHSEGDDIIPYHHGEKLYDEAGSNANFLKMRGSHNDGWLATGPDYLLAWDKFIERVLK